MFTNLFLSFVYTYFAASLSKEPEYLCILPDGDFNSCPNILDLTDETTDSVATSSAMARSVHRRSKRKFLRKEDSGIIAHSTIHRVMSL